MALTVTNEKRIPLHDGALITATATFDSSYPTGGEAIAASDFTDLKRIDQILVNNITAKYHIAWDRANAKLIAFVEDGTSGIEAQVADTTDLSAISVELVVVGS